MTDTSVRVPRLARRLLEWSAAKLGTAELPDDAAELFRERVRTHGVRAARRWYRWQAWLCVARVLLPVGSGGIRSWLSSFAIDVKLGARMFAKYPGLSLVSVLGMSVAIAIGAGGFGLVHSLIDAPVPLDEGERVVSLQNSDPRTPGMPYLRATHDFLLWRSEARSVVDISAFRNQSRNLSVPGGATGNVLVAAMSASGFRVARVAPEFGRYLLDADEQPGAQPVLVIAHEEWQERFAGDRHIIGRTVLLDTVAHTIVGVMPPGFRFPIADRYWTPLKLDPNAYAVGSGPTFRMFGRLADGATLEQAQAELTTLGRRMAIAHPQTHARLRPWIRPYTHPFVGIDSPARAFEFRSFQLGLSLLLLVVAVNVAVLVYARTAARAAEIAVRTALGASRRRVVTQLFVEALVLTATASIIGLSIASIGFGIIRNLISAEGVPFWMKIGLSPPLVLYVAGLAVLAAAIVGIVPALKTVGRSSSLQQLTARGSSMRLGRLWTTLIVVQVAIAAAVLPYSLYSSRQLLRGVFARPDYPVAEILRTSVTILRADHTTAITDTLAQERAIAARFAASTEEIVRRIAVERDVAGVTFASAYPDNSAAVLQIEIEGVPYRDWVWVNNVAVDLFDVFDVPIVAGRSFTTSDAIAGSTAVIVDRAFAEQLLPDGSIVGRRIRLWSKVPNTTTQKPGPWLEIVGVVPAFVPLPAFQRRAPKLYRPLALTDAAPTVHLAIRAKPGISPATLSGRVREIVQGVDGALYLSELQTAADADRLLKKGFMSLVLGIIAVTGSVLLLSAAGIYAMMSFTVVSRRREIGIRAALGAAPRRLMAGIFRRAGAQLLAGIIAGLFLEELLLWAIGVSTLFAGDGILLIPAVVALIATIGFLAALGPARRGLAVQPTEALRSD